MGHLLKYCLIMLVAFESASSNANDCLSNWDKTKAMIHDLEDELICSGQDSWQDCFLPLIKMPEARTPVSNGPTVQCNVRENTAGAYPLGLATVPVQKLALFVNASVIVDDRLHHRVFINSAEEFYVHMQMHRQRVVDLGAAAYKKFPHLFPDLNLEQVKGVLSSHDLAKVNSNVLASNGDPFYRVLYNEGYGKRIETNWITELNTRDEAFMEEAYRKYDLNPAQRDQILKLEKIADLVDRVNNPVSPEEFGRRMFPVGATLKDKTLQEAVSHLEKRYFDIVKPHLYRPLSKEQYFKLYQELKRKEILSGLLNKGHAELSRRSLKSLLRIESKELMSRASAILAKKSVINFLSFANGAGLFFSDMDRVACDQIGHFDWAKVDGICIPVAGLTPKFINFIFMNEAEQQKALKSNRLQCEILKRTHDLQKVDRLKERRCQGNHIELSFDDIGSPLKIELDSGRAKKITYTPDTATARKSIWPKIEFHLNTGATYKEICLVPSNSTQKKCINTKQKEQLDFISRQMLTEVESKINDHRFHIMKAVDGCLTGHRK